MSIQIGEMQKLPRNVSIFDCNKVEISNKLKLNMKFPIFSQISATDRISSAWKIKYAKGIVAIFPTLHDLATKEGFVS